MVGCDGYAVLPKVVVQVERPNSAVLIGFPAFRSGRGVHHAAVRLWCVAGQRLHDLYDDGAANGFTGAARVNGRRFRGKVGV
jgi:hypothetical protein